MDINKHAQNLCVHPSFSFNEKPFKICGKTLAHICSKPVRQPRRKLAQTPQYLWQPLLKTPQNL
jgi:hypothetical protein